MSRDEYVELIFLLADFIELTGTEPTMRQHEQIQIDARALARMDNVA